MKPMLVIKAVNGYVVVPYEGEIPQPDLTSLNIAGALESNSWYSRGTSVQEILSAHFEPPQAEAVKEAA
jgi:hypothetical protein